jgi:hypothetical protein
MDVVVSTVLAAVINYHRIVGLDHKNLLSYSSVGQKLT